jgi:trans-aconitate 2-methyltransferase
MKTRHKWNAEDYARNSRAQLEWAQELIEKLALRGDEAVLDVGCGDGKISARLALATRGNVVGIDLSEDMIELARNRFPAESYPNLSFSQMDATDIRLSARFDVAFSNAVLHWVGDHVAVLRGVHACLNTGGRLLFQMGGRGNAAEVFEVMEEVVRRPRWASSYEGFRAPYHFYGPEEYEEWLPQCGFRPLRIELVAKDMQHAGAEGLVGWLRTTWFPYTDRLPADLHDGFLAEVAERYLAAHPIDAAGSVHVGMVRLEIEALVP